jgi:hypothetical protein
MKSEFKEYELLEDIIIPKGTVFVECNYQRMENPLTAVIGEGLKNSVINVAVSHETIKEMKDKFKEI